MLIVARRVPSIRSPIGRLGTGGVKGAASLAAMLAWPTLVANAAPFDNQPKLLLHAVPAAGPTCASLGLIDCRNATTAVATGVGAMYTIYLVAAPGNLESVLGMRFGITYGDGSPEADADGAGFDVLSWTNCAPHQFTGNGWPKPGGGNILIWSAGDCRTEQTAVAGYFYCAAYGPDRLQLTPSFTDNMIEVARCNNANVVLDSDDLGAVVASVAGAEPGCNPCVEACTATSVVSRTWSGIKAGF